MKSGFSGRKNTEKSFLFQFVIGVTGSKKLLGENDKYFIPITEELMLGDFMNESKLLADSKASPWKIDKIRGRNKQVRWVPIIDVSGMGFFLGIDEEGKWVADSKDDIIEISSKSSVPLLPALELAYYEFCSKLSECVSKLGLPDSVMSTFPLTDTIRCGLEQVSDYWAESALNWCENYEKTELQRNLKDALEKLFFEKRASQKVRQRAKRLLEKIR